MKTLGEVLLATAQFLKGKGHSRARRIAEELLSFSLSIKRLDIYMQFDRPLVETELETVRTLLKRAAKGEPIEYIVGEVSFYQCSIAVNSDVLIPRPETEILVDLACKQLKLQDLSQAAAWDLCTGSGCIGIAVKKACPELQMTLVDLSEEALAMAADNALRNEVDVEVVQGDFLQPLCGRKVDVVLCNPPYVSAYDYLALDPSVKDFEPKLALVGGEDGLDFYRRLKRDLPSHLNPGARIFLEVGTGQGSALMDLFSGEEWKNARVEKDWAGHDRFFFLEFESSSPYAVKSQFL
jgi:release factor glutamine methyltransferase